MKNAKVVAGRFARTVLMKGCEVLWVMWIFMCRWRDWY